MKPMMMVMVMMTTSYLTAWLNELYHHTSALSCVEVGSWSVECAGVRDDAFLKTCSYLSLESKNV